MGFQSLKIASESNSYDLPIGFGIIGTYVAPDAAGKGVEGALFAASLKAAKEAGLKGIDAIIGTSNASGVAYYEALSIRTYKSKPGAICKIFYVVSSRDGRHSCPT
ncbi:MAG: GNAT family N-acetyltransferase [Rhodobacteraceae bacterium]|nr:GNAT family N-acetyltransferase [Paracoccaceae bacterium]